MYNNIIICVYMYICLLDALLAPRRGQHDGVVQFQCRQVVLGGYHTNANKNNNNNKNDNNNNNDSKHNQHNTHNNILQLITMIITDPQEYLSKKRYPHKTRNSNAGDPLRRSSAVQVANIFKKQEMVGSICQVLLRLEEKYELY